jgi:hypothetical protein
MGKFQWDDDINSLEAFSILACYHWGASAREAAKLGGNEMMSMHVRVTNGNGICEADVKVTKMVLLATKHVDILSKQLGVYSVMCQAIFGANSDIIKELTGWVGNILTNETTYWHQQATDAIYLP